MPFDINASRDSISLTQSTITTALTDNQKAKYEAKIKELETKLSKLQEGKLDKTEAMLEVTQENS